MINSRLLLCVSALFLCTLPALAKNTDTSRPNVLLILADDMGIDSVSTFNPDVGQATPAIDQLAKEGASFLDAHSTSGVCTPTRYSVLTGRYNWRSRLKRGIVGKWERPLIEDARLTLPEMLKTKGYNTAAIGKWHLGWNWPKKGGGFTADQNQIDFTQPVMGGPNDHGFDYAFGDDVPNWPPYCWRENEMLIGPLTATMKGGAMVGVSSGPAVSNWDFTAVLPEYARRCSAWVTAQAKEEAPFFLYVPLPSPHTPIAPDKTWLGKSKVSPYADFLLETDWAVGHILQALEESGQADNTLVIFTCDNGTSPKANFPQLETKGVHLRKNWRGTKADAFEGGHRVPFILRWPGRIPAGARSSEVISLADIMATVADAVDISLPPTAAEDSVSVLPAAQGKPLDTPLHDVVINHSISGHFAIRKGDWKLLHCRGSGGWSTPTESQAAKQKLPAVQLYNLATDPKEQNNLQAKHPERVRELTADLLRVINNGRSTPGPKQVNHNNQNTWTNVPKLTSP